MIPPRIFILEEDLHLQWIMKTYLESKGFSIIVSDKVEKVLEIASKGKISIFITEYWINHSNTLETIRKLKKILPRIYVLLTTYRIIDEKEYHQIFEAGVDELFEKPFSLEKMINHLEGRISNKTAFLMKQKARKGYSPTKRLNRSLI
jgi:DNA-binding NtrC family response regulator